MPSRNRHREKVKGLQASTDWTDMLLDKGERVRLMRDNPGVALALDYLAGQMRTYPGEGWNTFNNWLDLAYKRYFDKRPPEILFVTLEEIRTTVFSLSAARMEKDRIASDNWHYM